MNYFALDLDIDIGPVMIADIILEKVDEQILWSLGLNKENLGQTWIDNIGLNVEETRALDEQSLRKKLGECCFRSCDKSGDGYIQLSEAKELYRGIWGGELTEAEVTQDMKELIN